jgi:hypothetical protein
MKIALDFDNTFTRDPDFWVAFVNMARGRGHDVSIVTSRYPNCPVPITGVEVIYCGFTAKRKHFQADVWIDDDPKHIDLDHDPHL